MSEAMNAVCGYRDIPAAHYFSARGKFAMIEEKMFCEVVIALGADPGDPTTWPCDDIEFDDTDMSVEIKNVRPGFQPTLAQLHAIVSLGFKSLWTRYTNGQLTVRHLRPTLP